MVLKISEPGQSENQTQENEIIVGIDLGTTNSLIGVVENDEVKIFADGKNCDVVPSVVAFDDVGNVVSVGKNAQKSDVKNVIFSVKRLMGKAFDDVAGEKFPFEIISENDEKNKQKSLRIKVGEKQFSAEEVSSEILKHLKNLAEKSLKKEVKKAVITVPAYFDEAAKSATKFAAQLAGLEVIRLLNEPTAAALAYGLDNDSEGTYCVYDLGGGTFDVSILKMQRGVFKVLGVTGNNQFGGDDLDRAIIEKFPFLNHQKAREVKEKLSSKSSVKLINDSKMISFTYDEFAQLIEEKIQRTIKLTENLIDDLELETTDIKGVILVGGSTRVPLIRKKLGEVFGEEKILTNLDPDRVVAIGAIWQADNLNPASNSKKENLLLDVVPLSLGIEIMGGIVDKIIYRNTTIPTAYGKEFTTYADNQTGMKFHIVQGERELAKDCRSLAEFEVKKIPPLPAGMARVKIIFQIDADGLLTISAEEKYTGEKQEIIVKPSYGLAEKDVKEMLIESMQHSKEDMQTRLLIEVQNEAKKDITIIKNDLKKYDAELAEVEKNSIAKKLRNLENLVKNSTDREEIQAGLKALEKVSENLVLIKVNAALNQQIAGKKVDELS